MPRHVWIGQSGVVKKSRRCGWTAESDDLQPLHGDVVVEKNAEGTVDLASVERDLNLRICRSRCRVG
jgi:hypothetical protein